MIGIKRRNTLQAREARLLNEIRRLNSSIGAWRQTAEGPTAERKLKKLKSDLAVVRRQLQAKN
jgi:hypothetical protein